MLKRLRKQLYVLAFVDVFGPLYALYTLWFVDHGISTREISTVFLLWAGLPLLLELPSGALADRVDSRRFLAAASLFRGAGIAVWMVWPTYEGVLAGASLWAIHTAAFSGAWEAMIHDQLEEIGDADRYAAVMARVGQFASLGVVAGTVAALGLTATGATIQDFGWMTVAVHVAGIGLVLRLPTVAAHSPESDLDSASGDSLAEMTWWETLRSGVSEAGGSVVILRLVVIGAFMEGLSEIDEYVPILGRGRGASNTEVLVLVFAIWVGLLLGGEVAARRTELSGRTLGLLLLGAAIGFGGGLSLGGLWSLLLIAAGYAAMEVVWVLSDARLQERTGRATRATVVSVRGFVSAIVNIGFFAIVALLADGDDPSPGLGVAVAVLAFVGLAALLWLPRASLRPESEISATH